MPLRRRLLLSLVALAACKAAEPSPEQLRAALVKHPDIIYDVIRAHPDSFFAVLNVAAQGVQQRAGVASAAQDSARIENDFAHPHVVSTAGRAGFGSPAAPVTIVEYTDFECPYCRQERDVIVSILKAYPGKVRLVVKQLPIASHPHAYEAALMFEAVARQSPAAAYRLYDVLYTNQDQLKARGSDYLAQAVVQAGADSAQARRDANTDAIRAVVTADQQEAQQLGFTGTPGFLVNGVQLQGAYPRSAFEQVINRLLAARGAGR
ncbi:MAG: disulfide interchange protein [Gemmatimonadetes bacterium]|nr:disulfide interchange protein [Gemmatimonadota bacterium]